MFPFLIKELSLGFGPFVRLWGSMGAKTAAHLLKYDTVLGAPQTSLQKVYKC